MKQKNIWIIEIIIWLLVLGTGLFLFIYNTQIKANAQNTYYIFVDDAEGLVKGSPVRFMGINCGYVKDIKIFDNKVFVSFLITSQNLEIPKGTSASIAFYGLGGSTSLELNPATASEALTSEDIINAESYRVQDFWDGQALVSNVLIDIYGGVGRNIENADIIKYKPYFKQSELIQAINNDTNRINTLQGTIINKLEKNKIIKGKEINQNE